MKNYPRIWFANITRLQEKRPYSTFVLLCFSIFVAVMRHTGEWALTGVTNKQTLGDLLLYVVFYWSCFFTYGLILKLLVPVPWRSTINLILIGVFLGILPPVIDFWAAPPDSLHYVYCFDFPQGWNIWMYSPDSGIPFGEAAILWTTVLFTGLYVFHRTGNILKFALALLLAYGVVVLNGALLATGAELITTKMGWTTFHRLLMLSLGHLFVPLAIYLYLQPRLFWGLASRINHALPFVLMVFLGSALLGKIYPETFLYAFLVLLTFAVALAQNDMHDQREDNLQGRRLYLDQEDLNFLNITLAMVIATLLMFSTVVGAMLLLILVLSFLYSYPFYRGKKYFPSNLKMEGAWGAASFLIGIIAYVEHQAFGMPRWFYAGMEEGTIPGALDLYALWAILLIFGGYSIVAALKDYKDWEADLASDIQTLYTLAKRRGWRFEKLHQSLILAACVCLLAPFPLLAWAGKLNILWGAGALAPVAVIAWNMRRPPSENNFDNVLLAIDGFLVYLTIALLMSAPLV